MAPTPAQGPMGARGGGASVGRGIASWPARALLSGAVTGAGHGFSFLVVRAGCAVVAPHARLPPPPTALPPGGSAVSVSGSGSVGLRSAVWTDILPKHQSAAGPAPDGGVWRGYVAPRCTWRCGRLLGDTVLPPQRWVRRGLPFPDPSGSPGFCSLMKSGNRLAPRVPTSLLPGGCGSQDAPA